MKVNEELKKNQNVNFKKIVDVFKKFEQFHQIDKYIQNKFSDQTKDLTKKLQKRKRKAVDIITSNIINNSDTEEVSPEINLMESMNNIINSSLLEINIKENENNTSNQNIIKANKVSSNVGSRLTTSEVSSSENESSKTIPTLVNSELIIENPQSYIEAKNYLDKVEQSMEKRMTIEANELDISEHQIEMIDDATKEEFIKHYERYQSEQTLEASLEEEELKKESQREIMHFQQNGFNINAQENKSLESDLLLDSCDVFLQNQQGKQEQTFFDPENVNTFYKQEEIQVSEIGMEDIPMNYLSNVNGELSNSEKNLISAINLKDSVDDNKFYCEEELVVSKETDLMDSLRSQQHMFGSEKKTLAHLAEDSKYIKTFDKPKLESEETNFEEINGDNEFLISTIGEGMQSIEPGIITEQIVPEYTEPFQQFGDSLTEYQNLQPDFNYDDNFNSGLSVGLNYEEEIRISKELELLNEEIETSRISMNESMNTVRLIEELNQKTQDSQI